MQPGVHNKPTVDFRQIRMVIAKVTSSCNLRCRYCCADAIPVTQPGATMTMETHQRAATMLIGGTESDELQWIFHGGEPMLLPIPWYEEAIEFCITAAEANPRIRRLTIGMQSNLTRLTPEYLQLVKKYRIQIGTSLDGPPRLSDVYRQAGKRVEETIELLMREDAPPGVIAQINKNTIAHMDEVVDYFDKKGFAVMFNATCPTGRGMNVENLTGEELYNAKRKLLERADQSANLRILGPDLLRQLFFFHTGQRDMAERNCHGYNCGAGVTLIGVDPNGDVWPCGRSTDADMSKLGNVNDPGSLRSYESTLRSFHEKDLWYLRCFGCAAKLICLFGCTAFDKDSISTREIECLATRLLHQYFWSHPELVERLVARFQTHMEKTAAEVREKKHAPPFLPMHTGHHPCSSAATAMVLSAQARLHPIQPDGTEPARIPQTIE
ncbi:MAG: radical SAM protein [Verrucomicrobia bacterium]|nr:radical SAM protein [Verrucomicrobiota bacterium]